MDLWRNKFDESRAATSSARSHTNPSLNLWRTKFNVSRISEGYTKISERGRLWLAAARRLNDHRASRNKQDAGKWARL